MKATFRSDPARVCAVTETSGRLCEGCGGGLWSQMVPSLGTLLEKGKALSNTEEVPEEWELLWANQRDSPSLTNRFSSKILGLRAPQQGVRGDGSEGYRVGRETWSCQHTERAVWLVD